jgi:hypothetical protein
MRMNELLAEAFEAWKASRRKRRSQLLSPPWQILALYRSDLPAVELYDHVGHSSLLPLKFALVAVPRRALHSPTV